MDNFRQRALKPDWTKFGQWDTGQKRGEDRPAIVKPIKAGGELFDLIPVDELKKPSMDVFEAICNRRSVRKFSDEAISLNALTYLLISTNGILNMETPTRRTVPSGGARHAIETYLYIKRVEGLEKGLYRYLPDRHQLVNVHYENLHTEKDEMRLTFGAPLTFLWTAVPYRMAWRYGDASEKLLLLDAGHICQNLYLACEALGLGTCAVGAYDQVKLDDFMQVDGEEELLLYAAPVGKKI